MKKGENRIQSTLLGLFLLFAVSVFGQNTNISGVVNEYFPVTGINTVKNSLLVPGASMLSVGERLLLIQMQGATINTSNTPDFGNIISYNGAGSYEFVIVCSVDGDTVVLENTLLNTDYSPSGKIQLVRYPELVDATVTATLTGDAWNGNTGGVVILDVSGTLTLNADIDMRGKGFRGGVYQDQDNDVCTNAVGFPVTNSNYSYGDFNYGGEKGEGIAIQSAGMEYGKGAQANGGGGGNDHNAGGGGGGNVSAGGRGGDNDDQGGFFNCRGFSPGVGGKAQTGTGRIYMGGGGGSGHGNNAENGGGGSSGSAGGGIIIIKANTIAGNNHLLTVRGENVAQANHDGAGGAGGAGSIQLEVSSWTGTTNLIIRGGNGGKVFGFGGRCYGPGGGGCGGVIKTVNALPASAPVTLLGGNAGTIIAGDASCLGTTVGATPGTSGIVETTTFPESLNPNPNCLPLPVRFLSFSAIPKGQKVQLEWVTAFEIQNAQFTVERSRDGNSFSSLATIPGAGNSGVPLTYGWDDYAPYDGTSWYRIRQTDFNGASGFSGIVEVHFAGEAFSGMRIFPNPVRSGDNLVLVMPGNDSDMMVLQLFDLTGKVIRSVELARNSNGLWLLPTQGLPAGTYLLEGKNRGDHFRGKMVVLQ
jgi:hypothetical protein